MLVQVLEPPRGSLLTLPLCCSSLYQKLPASCASRTTAFTIGLHGRGGASPYYSPYSPALLTRLTLHAMTRLGRAANCKLPPTVVAFITCYDTQLQVNPVLCCSA